MTGRPARALAIARPAPDPLAATKRDLRENMAADRDAREAATRARANLRASVVRARKAAMSWNQIAATLGCGVMTAHDLAHAGKPPRSRAHEVVPTMKERGSA